MSCASSSGEELNQREHIEFNEYEGHPENIDELPTMTLLETERLNRFKTNFDHLNSDKQTLHVKKAKLYFKKGQTILQKGDNNIARRYYEKAIYLDPNNPLYNYARAIALYHQGFHVRSLALLEISHDSTIDESELNYYEALNYMKLGDTTSSIKLFDYVVADKDPQLSPSAAMYAGLLLRQENELSQAKERFQYVLDTTKNAELDKRAEKQIEELIAIEKFQEESKKKFSVSAYTGLMYDSNVLNIAQNNASLNVAAYRLMYGGSVDYKALYTPRHTLAPRLSFSDIYSVDKSFKSNSTIQSADPLQAEFALPYTYSFFLFDKSSTVSFYPAYSQIYMSLDESGRDLIYSSYALASTLTTSHFEKWISSYRLDLTNDTFHPNTTPDNDQTASKVGLSINNTRLFDSTGTKSLALNMLFLQNNAKGKNSFYDRYMLSIVGSYPMSESLLSYAKIDYLTQNYSKSETQRLDHGLIFTAGSVYSLKKNLSLNFSAQYNSNSSNVQLYDYNKFTVMTMLSYNSGFF
ncbi:MAG: hypothetical protein H6623_03975 [Bdellovibrionaceae bacterium]|nr:hypothetical protein [Pseudobdellovibrionaceae bacterium]